MLLLLAMFLLLCGGWVEVWSKSTIWGWKATSTAFFYSSNNCSVNNDMELGWGWKEKKPLHEKKPKYKKSVESYSVRRIAKWIFKLVVCGKASRQGKGTPAQWFRKDAMEEEKTRENIKRFSSISSGWIWKMEMMWDGKPLFFNNSFLRDTKCLE